MQLSLKVFKTKILDAVASGKLASNSVFKEYFRGLYFKMEKSGSSVKYSNVELLKQVKYKIQRRSFYNSRCRDYGYTCPKPLF
jgi:hypothetical protein